MIIAKYDSMRIERAAYRIDLTDDQWAVIVPFFEGMRNRRWAKRELVNAILYKVDNGCKWRNLPHDFPPWQSVYSFFSRAKKSGLWDEILLYLVEITRQIDNRSPEPTYGIIDSQSVKTSGCCEDRGIDGGKKN